MKLARILIAAVCAALSMSGHAQTLTERTIKKGHMVCYTRADLSSAWAGVQDENYMIPQKLIQEGKCIMLANDRKFQVADFNPNDSVQAVVFPSGQWGRVATVSIKK